MLEHYIQEWLDRSCKHPLYIRIEVNLPGAEFSITISMIGYSIACFLPLMCIQPPASEDWQKYRPLRNMYIYFICGDRGGSPAFDPKPAPSVLERSCRNLSSRWHKICMIHWYIRAWNICLPVVIYAFGPYHNVDSEPIGILKGKGIFRPIRYQRVAPTCHTSLF